MTSSLFCDACGAASSVKASVCPVCGQTQQSSVPQHLSPTTEFKPGFLLRQRYQILEKVGAGGFGLVYKAWDKQGGIVAIKQITLAALSAQEMIEATASYNREITILPRLKHKNLPDLYDHFTDPGHWYIVMEYIYGQTLEEKLGKTSDGRLSVGEVLHIGAQLCDVLGYLHVQDPPVIFRDVKPANVMIAPSGSVYLIDFGIARRYREGQNKDTRPLGSPGYAAPEQYGKAQSTPRTDMYSLGATLQTLLIGKEPLEVQTMGIPAGYEIPTELQTLITQMMERNLDKRPGFMWTVGQSLRDLQKRYPLPTQPFGVAAKSPFAWLATVWVLCMLAVLPFVLFNPVHPIFTIVALCFLLFALCIVVGVTASRFSKARRGISDKLPRKGVHALVKDGLAGSFFWIWQFCTWESISLMGEVIKHSDSKTLIVFIVWCVVSMIGAILIIRGWLPFLKRAKQVKIASQNQQVEQVHLIQQQTEV